MGYILWQGEAISMKNGTISIWFRVPAESIAEVPPAESETGWDFEVFNAGDGPIIPIIAFSKQQDGPFLYFEQPVINTFYHATSPIPPFDFQPFPYYGSIATTRQSKMSPSMIGIYVKDGKAYLVAHLQTSDMGQGINTQADLVSAEGETGGSGMLFGPTSLAWTNSSALDQQLEFFPPNINAIEVEVDKWHHVLLSWDLQESNSSHGRVDEDDASFAEMVDSSSLLYCAFDDKNLTKTDRPCAYWFDDMDDNAIFCEGAFHLAGNPYHSTAPDYWGPPTYSVTFAKGIEMDTIAVPSEPRYERTPFGGGTQTVQPNMKIDIAELQIFADLTLDTDDLSKRRAFIAPDGDGDMVPVNPKETERLLGRRPDVLVHQTSNWKKGKNTGKIGLERMEDEPDQIIASGQFVPHGDIKGFKPDPILAPSPPPPPPP